MISMEWGTYQIKVVDSILKEHHPKPCRIEEKYIPERTVPVITHEGKARKIPKW